jgi:peptidoglycan/xylan/chitin deacetylase (PgdA/CDA1 family)
MKLFSPTLYICRIFNRIVSNNSIYEYFFSFLSKIPIYEFMMKHKKGDKLNSNFIILEYHRTTQESFRRHMNFLVEKNKIISYEDFLTRFINCDFPSEPLYIITFDDGFNDVYSEVVPICNEYSIPIIVFLTTGNIINRELLWWEEARELNRMGCDISIQKLKQFISADRKKILDGYKKKINYNPKKCELLTEAQISEMGKNKLISFGSHTVTHTNLAAESDSNIDYELTSSKLCIEKLIGKRISHLAYPNGDYNSKVIEISKKIGYKSALIEGDSWVSKNNDLFKIPRVGAGLSGCSDNWLKYRIWQSVYHKPELK